MRLPHRSVLLCLWVVNLAIELSPPSLSTSSGGSSSSPSSQNNNLQKANVSSNNRKGKYNSSVWDHFDIHPPNYIPME
ncbi:hypothetical protein vseg_019815 [Gypsophila vaccaria]